MPPDQAATDRQKLSGRKILTRTTLALGVVVLVCVGVILSFPDAFLRKFVERRITNWFAVSYPGYRIRLSGTRLGIVNNRIACDTVIVIRDDSSFCCSIASLSAGGIHWPGLLRGSGFDPGCLAGSSIEAGDVRMTFRRFGYGYRCGPLRVSVPDSVFVAEALEIRPLVNDEQFFGGSGFRKTRFGFGARKCSVSGLSCIDLLQGRNLHARSVRLQDISAEVLINKDKPPFVGPPGPLMPGEILAAMKDTVGLDSLIITDGRLTYSERMAIGRKPATLSFDGLQVLVTGIASHSAGGPRADVQARGNIVGGGSMNLAMSIPLSVQGCSFRYSGSCSGMDMSTLNSFIEVSDDMRIKTGRLESAVFDIDVDAGSATGSVRAVYRNLIFASINGRTGSENGILDTFSSWIARKVKIRGTNTPDSSGAMKIGTVRYTRQKNDPFFGFAWFALRSGVGDIVGF